MLTSIFGLAGIAGKLGGALFSWLQAKTVSQEQTTVATIQAQSQAAHDEFAWPETRWMIACTIAAFNLHLWAVVIDTVFRMHWGIPTLPAPMDSWEGNVLLAPFAAAGLLGVAKRIFGK